VYGDHLLHLSRRLGHRGFLRRGPDHLVHETSSITISSSMRSHRLAALSHDCASAIYRSSLPGIEGNGRPRHSSLKPGRENELRAAAFSSQLGVSFFLAASSITFKAMLAVMFLSACSRPLCRCWSLACEGARPLSKPRRNDDSPTHYQTSFIPHGQPS